MDEQVFLTLVRDGNEDQELEINNDVTLLDLIDFFLGQLQLQIDDSDGIQCVNKPENIFYQDQFHLNMKQIQQMTGEKRLKFKIVKRQKPQVVNNFNAIAYQQQQQYQQVQQISMPTFAQPSYQQVQQNQQNTFPFNPFQDPRQTIEFGQQQNVLTQSEQLIQLDIQLFQQQVQTLELASTTSLQEILEYLVTQFQIDLGNDEIHYEDAGGLKLHPGTFASQIQIYNNKRLVKIQRAPTSMIIEIFFPDRDQQEVSTPLDTRLDELIATLADSFPQELTPGITLNGVEVRDYAQQLITDNIEMRQIRANPNGKHQLFIKKSDIPVEIKYFTGSVQQFEINKTLTVHELLIEMQKESFIKATIDIQTNLIIKDFNEKIIKLDELVAKLPKNQYGKHYIGVFLKKEEIRQIKLKLKNFKKQAQIEEFKFPDITTLQGALDIIKNSTLFGQQFTNDDDIKLYNINTSQEITLLTQKLSECVIMNHDELEYFALIYNKYIAAKKYVNIQFRNMNSQVIVGKIELEQTATIQEAIQAAMGNVQGKKFIFYDMRYEDKIDNLEQSIKDVFGNNLEITIGFQIEKPPVQQIQEPVSPPQPIIQPQPLSPPQQQFQQFQQPLYQQPSIQQPQFQQMQQANISVQQEQFGRQASFPESPMPYQMYEAPAAQNQLYQPPSNQQQQYLNQPQIQAPVLGYTEFVNRFQSNNSSDSSQNRQAEPSKYLTVNIQNTIGLPFSMQFSRQNTFGELLEQFYLINEYQLDSKYQNKDLLYFSQSPDNNSRINSNLAIKELFPIEDQAKIYLQLDQTQKMNIEQELKITFKCQNKQVQQVLPYHSTVAQLYEIADTIGLSQFYQLQDCLDLTYFNRFDNSEIMTYFKSNDISINVIEQIPPQQNPQQPILKQNDIKIESPLNQQAQLLNQGNVQGNQGNLISNPPNPFPKQINNQLPNQINIPQGLGPLKQLNFYNSSENKMLVNNNQMPANPFNQLNPNQVNPIANPITNPINKPINTLGQINPQINQQINPSPFPIRVNPFLQQNKIIPPIKVPILQNQQNPLQGQQLSNKFQQNDNFRQTIKYQVKIYNYDQELNIQVVPQRTIQDFENQIYSHLQQQPSEDSCVDLMVNDRLFGKNRPKNTDISKLFSIQQESVMFEAFYRSFGNFEYTENVENSIPINVMIIDGNFNTQLQLYMEPQLTLQVLHSYAIDYLAINQKLRNNVMVDIIVNGNLLKPQFLKKPFRLLNEQEKFIQIKLKWLDKSDDLQI